MSLLLCRQKAQMPFSHEKLNIRIWTEQELSFVIYNYPLLCMAGFVGERLYSWIDNELQMKLLASKLRQSAKIGETPENQLLLILQECNYYDVSEVMAFGQRMAEMRKYSLYEITCMEAKALFRAGNYNPCYEKFCTALRELELSYRRSKSDEREAVVYLAKLADLYCDMAVVKMQLFDENAALELLDRSTQAVPNRRAEELRYLINGNGILSDEEKQKLDERREAAGEEARNSKTYREISRIFEQERPVMFAEAGKLAATWKNSYRRM